MANAGFPESHKNCWRHLGLLLSYNAFRKRFMSCSVNVYRGIPCVLRSVDSAHNTNFQRRSTKKKKVSYTVVFLFIARLWGFVNHNHSKLRQKPPCRTNINCLNIQASSFQEGTELNWSTPLYTNSDMFVWEKTYNFSSIDFFSIIMLFKFYYKTII